MMPHQGNDEAVAAMIARKAQRKLLHVSKIEGSSYGGKTFARHVSCEKVTTFESCEPQVALTYALCVEDYFQTGCAIRPCSARPCRKQWRC